MDPHDDKEREINEAGQVHLLQGQRHQHRDQADAGHAKHSVQFPAGIQRLDFIELQFSAPTVGVQIERGQDEINGGEAHSVNHKQSRAFGVSELTSGAAQDHSVDEEVEKKLQRIDVKQNNEEHEAGQEPDE